MISRNDIRNFLADGYYRFAKNEGTDMQKVANILETLRPHFSEQPEYNVWKEIPFSQSDLENDVLIQMLAKLKDDYYALVCKKIIQHVQQLSANDPAEGFKLWLRLYVAALVNYEGLVYDRIDDADYSFSPENQAFVKNTQKIHDYIRDKRWGECYEHYAKLAENVSLFPLQRAILHSMSAQIQIYFGQDFSMAMEHLETAKQIYPEPNAKIERVFGEWHLKKQDFDKARQYFMNAMTIDLSDSEAIIAMGDSYRDEIKATPENKEAKDKIEVPDKISPKWQIAEDYYKKAISNYPFDSGGYESLIYLYGEPFWFKEKEDAIIQLLHKIEVLNLNASDKKYSNWCYNAYLAMGYIYSNNKEIEKAVEWYKKAIKFKPGCVTAHVEFGNMYFHLEDFESAKKHYEKALAANPESYEACWALGGYYEQVAQFRDAIQYYQQCIQIRPYAEKDVNFIIADLYINHLDSPAEAINLLLQMSSRYPEDSVVFEKLAAAHEQAGDSAESEKYYRKALEINPKSNNNWNELGIIHYRRKDFAEAAKHFEKAIEVHPDEPVYYTNLADAYQNNNEPHKLKVALEQGLKKFPENGDLYNRLGNYYYVLGDYEKALAAYQKAIEDLSTDAVVNANLAGAYKILGNWEKAGKYYQQALLLSPENDTYMNEAGVAAFRSGDFSTAVTFFKKAAAQLPSDATYFDNLAQAYNELPGNEAEAEQAFLEAVRLSPDNDLIQNRLGNFYLLHQKYEKALAHYQIATRLKPDHPIYTANEGYTQCYLGDIVSAIHNLEKAVALDPSITTIHNWLALAYVMHGDQLKGADYLLAQMQKLDDPELLTTFLEIYAKVPDTSTEYARNALQIIQSQPNINTRYEAMLTNGN